MEPYVSKEPQNLISTPIDPTFTIQAANAKKILWITPDGKIHVDPDSPADETARKVLKALCSLTNTSLPRDPKREKLSPKSILRRLLQIFYIKR